MSVDDVTGTLDDTAGQDAAEDVTRAVAATAAPGLQQRAQMGDDTALRERVRAALAAQALTVLGQGHPGSSADGSTARKWGLALRMLAPSDEDVARAQWAVAVLADGPAGSYAVEGAADGVSDEALRDAVARVWGALAGA